jgi:hypothetical protein
MTMVIAPLSGCGTVSGTSHIGESSSSSSSSFSCQTGQSEGWWGVDLRLSEEEDLRMVYAPETDELHLALFRRNKPVVVLTKDLCPTYEPELEGAIDTRLSGSVHVYCPAVPGVGRFDVDLKFSSCW